MKEMNDNQLYAHQWRWSIIGFCIVVLSASTCQVIQTRDQLKAPRIGTTTVTTTTIVPIGN
jgi:hypothetical protein